VEATTAVREAKLKPESADRYPMLPARMWTSASWMAALVASYRGERPERTEKPERDRTLSDDDFEFRGGPPANGTTYSGDRTAMNGALSL
jgi:hypothetical protein